MIAGQLEIQLMADLGRIKSDMDQVKNIVGGAMSAVENAVSMAAKAFALLGVAASVNAFKDMVMGAIEAQAELKRLSERTGTTVETLSGLKGVAKLSGTSMDDVAVGVQKLSKSMLAAQDGTGKQAMAFKALGITSKELADAMNNPGQMMLVMAKHMAEFRDGTAKNNVAMELMGKAGANLLPLMRELAEKGQLNAKVTAQQAAEADKFEKLMIQWNGRWKELYGTIATEILPALNEFMGALVRGGGVARTFTDYIKDLAKSGKIREWAQDARAAIELLMNTIVPAAKIAAAYFAVFIAAPAVFTAVGTAAMAVIGPLAVFTMNVMIGQTTALTFSSAWAAANTTLFGTAVAANTAAGGLFTLKTAGAALFAAFAGWQIGSWLRENFVEARVAGLAFVGAMLTGWENIKYGAQLVWEGVKYAFETSINTIKAGFGNYLSVIATGIKLIGADSAATSIDAFAQSLTQASTSQKTFAEQTAWITAEHKSNLAAIDDNIVGLVQWELKNGEAAKAVAKTGEAARGTGKDLKYGGDAAVEAAKAYAALISSIRAKTDENMLELRIGEKAAESQKIEIKFNEDLAAGKLKLAAAQIEAVRAAIQALAVSENMVKMYNAEKDVMNEILRSTIVRNESKDALEAEYRLYGKSAEAREIAMIAIRSEAAQEKFILDQRKAGKPVTQEMIAQLDAERKKRDEVTQASYAQGKALQYAQQLADENKRFAAESILLEEDRAAAILQIDADLWRKRIDAAGDGTEAQKELIKQYNEWYANQASKPQLEQQREVWQSIDGAAHDAFKNILNGGKDTFTKLRDTLKSTLLDLLYQMTIKRWVFNIVASITGAAASGAAQAAGSSLIGGMAGSAGAGLFGTGSMLGGFGQGISAAFAAEQGIFGSFSSGLGYLTEGIGSASSSIGMMLPAIGAVVAGLYVLAGLLDSGPESDTFLQFGSNNLPGAININQRGNEGKSDAYIGANSKSPFGTFGVTGSFWMDNVNGENGKKFAAFMDSISASDARLSKYLTDAERASVVASLNATAITVHTGAEGADPAAAYPQVFADRMNAILNGIEPGLSKLVEGFKGSGDQLQAEVETLLTARKNIDAAVKTFGEPVTLQGLASSFESLKQDGETTGQVIVRLGAEFDATNALAKMFGLSTEQAFGAVGLASAGAREELIKAAGGLDAFKAQSANFFANFYTDDERKAMAVADANAQLNETFSQLGRAIPASTEEYRNLMATLLAAGDPAYQEVMNVSGAFVTVHGTAQQAADAANQAATGFESAAAAEAARAEKEKEIASERAGLQDQLNQLTMTSAELLALQRDALDESNRSLFDQVQAAQTAKKVDEERKGLQDQLDQLTLTAAELLAKQRDALDESNRALFDQIQSQQDLKRAMEITAAAREKELAATLALADYLEKNFYTPTEQAALKTAAAGELLKSVLGETADVAHMSYESFLDMLDALGLAPDKALEVAQAFIDIRGPAQDAADAVKGVTGALVDLGGSFVNPQDTIAQATDQFNAFFDQLKKNSATLGNGDYGVESNQNISHLQSYMAEMQRQIVLQEEWNRHWQGGEAALLALQTKLRLAQDALAGMSADYARYVVLEAQYAGHGKDLLDLEKWYATQQALFAGNQDDLTALGVLYEKKRLEIINGTLSNGLDQTAEQLKKWATDLRSWLQGLDQNSSLSPLTAQQQKDAAYAVYMSDLAKAQGGDQTAREAITKDAEAYLAAAKAVSGFGGDYSAIFAMIKDQIGALADAADPALAAPTVIDPISFDGTNSRIEGTTNAVKTLTDKVNEQTTTIAKLLERLNALTEKAAPTIAEAVNESGTNTSSAITRAAELTAKA